MAIPRAFRLLAFAVLAGLACPSLAQGQWLPQGVPLCTAPAVQRDPGVVPDGSGGAVVFWIDRRTGGHDVYAQRVAADGRIAPGWPVDGVLLSGQAGGYPPQGIPDGTGGAIVVWEDTRATQTNLHDLYAQRVTGAGSLAPGWPADGLPVCTASQDQLGPRLVPDGSGGAIIVWQDRRDDPGGPFPSPDIYALRVTAQGEVAPGWPVDGLAICTTPDEQWEPTICPGGAGGAIISWYDARNLATTGGDIFAQRITPAGEVAPGWAPDGVAVCTAPGHQTVSHTIADTEGGAILIWLDRRVDPDRDIYAQRIRGDGTRAPGWPSEGVALSTAPGYQFFLSVAPDGFGGALVAWEDYTQPSASDIYAQRVTAEGEIPPGWPPNGVPVCSATSFQLNPKVAPDGAGGAFVVWEDTRSGSTEDVYAQHVTASGAVALGWEPNGVAICTQPASQPKPAVASDGLGGGILAWSDLRNGNKDIFAHKLALDGPVPTLLSLMDVEAGSGEVLLTWYGSGAASLAAIVQRRSDGTEWVALGSPLSEGPDRLRYEDRSVEPGLRYAYRLAYRDEGAERFTEETWVDVPALTLSLAGFRPNPAVGTPTLVFSLPDDRPARLEVLDVRGRVVRSPDVGGLGAGAHVLPLAGETALPPGMYWIRLMHAERTLTTKGLVVR